jgi:hypothetical protein
MKEAKIYIIADTISKAVRMRNGGRSKGDASPIATK